MALVIAPPIIIDGTNFSRESSFTAHKFLFLRGTTVYALLQSQLDGSTAMYKSADEGQTWLGPLDAANAPTVGDALATYDDAASNLISFTMYLGTSVVFVDFNTSTDTYGVTSNPFNFLGTNWFPFAFYRNLAGIPTILMSQPGASFWAITYTAGAWSAPGAPIFTAPASASFGNGIRDSIGTYHLQFNTATKIYYVQVSNTLVASAATLLVTAFGGLNLGRLILDGANVRGSAVYQPSAGVNNMFAWAGTPLAAPAFTTYIVSTSNSGENYTYPDTVLDKDGNWVVVWALTSNTLDQEMMSTFGGATFDAPIVFYDAVANPPPNVDGPSNFIHTVDLTQFSDGTWLMLTAMETLDLGGACTGFALSTAPPPVTIAITCPVDGGTATVGIAYDAFLVVSGDTPPDTFVIASGSLPPGLTLNALTGEISGVPTEAGTFNYTVEVTDSLDHTATTDPGCEIVVAAAPPPPPPPGTILPCPTLFDVLGPENPDILINEPYSVNLVVIPGNSPTPGTIAPYVLTVTAGSLPTGLSLAGVTISGTPTVAGTFNFAITIEDANGLVVTEPFSITVSNPPAQL